MIGNFGCDVSSSLEEQAAEGAVRNALWKNKWGSRNTSPAPSSSGAASDLLEAVAMGSCGLVSSSAPPRTHRLQLRTQSGHGHIALLTRQGLSPV